MRHLGREEFGMGSMTFAEAAEAVLADTRRAMTADEIWAEIERRGLLQTSGKTPAATLYTEMMRKSANWSSEDDDRTPLFYRRSGGLFGRWADLAPEQQKAMLEGSGAQSPTAVWRELHDRVKDDPAWIERLTSLRQRRTEVGNEIGDRLRKYLAGTITLETLRSEFDQRTRTDWDSFGFGGTSFAMVLNQLAKTAAAHPDFEPLVKAAMAAPSDEKVARSRINALAARLVKLRETGNKRQLPHPNRIISLFSALWQIQAPEVWPTYYKSAREALAETHVVIPDEDDAIESYFAFRTPYKQLASELGLSVLELEQLCKLQQESSDDDEDDETVTSWLFQARPDVFDLRGALASLTDLTWIVRQHRKKIRENDTVYLWESGEDAALLAIARVAAAPAMTPREAPAQAAYYKDPDDAEGEAIRVRLTVERKLDPPLTRKQILAAPEATNEAHLFSTAQNTNVELPPIVVAFLEKLLKSGAATTQRRYWKVSPGSNAEHWPTMERDGVIAVSWHKLKVGDLRDYKSKHELETRVATLAPELSDAKRRSRVDQLWRFREISVGDVIVANRGFSVVVGEGTVTGEYFYRPDQKFPHARPVRWDRTDERSVGDQGPKWRPTVVALTIEEYEALSVDEEEDEADAAPIPPKPQQTTEPYTIQDALKQVFIAQTDLARLLDLLRYKKNLVLQGPPGVGKTFVAAELAYVLLGAKDESRIKRVQFHQSYAYEDFVRGYRPREEEAGGFEYRDGPMLTFCNKARNDSRPHVMIIDEINRGNLSKILGELMLLVEPDKRDARWSLELAYAKVAEPQFWVPPNVHIIGTMNTADRSIALVDYALRRRFVFATIPPAFGVGSFEAHLEGKGVAPALRNKLVTRISDLNKAIEGDTRNLGRGYVIGHSYFCQRDPLEAYDDAWYERIVRFEIEPLLDEYWAENPDKVRTTVNALLAP